MSLDQKILSELRDKLLREKERIELELGRIGKPTTNAGDFSTNFNEIGTNEDENASEVEEYADNIALEATLEKQLKDIFEALEKISTGSYGKCENCGIDISIERLQAYPSAKRCITC